MFELDDADDLDECCGQKQNKEVWDLDECRGTKTKQISMCVGWMCWAG